MREKEECYGKKIARNDRVEINRLMCLEEKERSDEKEKNERDVDRKKLDNLL